MSATHLLLYGLTIDSDVPIHRARTVTDDRPADIEIRLGPPIPPALDGLPGVSLADLDMEGSRYQFVIAPDGRYVLRYFGACDFVIDASLRCIEARPVQGADPALVGVLVAGSVPSFVLMMRGEPLLHASAVELDGRALAFVGSSGMGKSTLATLSCAAGGRLVTDDVLRLDLSGTAPRCHLGAGELRLRQLAGELAASFDVRPDARRTADDRCALQVEPSTADLLPLAAIVIPRAVRDVERTEVRRLDPVDALLTLSQFPRLVGWDEAEHHAVQFHHLASVSEQVGVYVADVPWGPPFAPGIAETIFEAVGVAPAAPVRRQGERSAGSTVSTTRSRVVS